MSTSCHCDPIDRHFGAERAAGELEDYRRRGPTGTARMILRTARALGVRPETLLDVGAGIGILHHELLAAGVATAVHVEAAQAYVDAARTEAGRRGQLERVRFLHGDFLALASTLEPADLVTLDRVVCCYPELEPLVRESVAKARRGYAVSYPLDRWYVRVHTAWQNSRRRRAGNPFRTFVHPPGRIRALLREGGLRVAEVRRTLVWEVVFALRDGPIAG